MNKTHKVTFGIVNCNRLHYLKSCLESLLHCTDDYGNKEVIVVDNASIEDGTDEYLVELKARGIMVFKQQERDPSNEFANALNIIRNNATGDFIVPLQGDMQFILQGNWLKKYVDFYWNHIDEVGCILLDAQRSITNSSHRYSHPENSDDAYKFVYDLNRPPINGAADVMYSKQVLDMIGPWKNKDNLSHEGGNDSETDMLMRTGALIKDNNLKLFCAAPLLPPAVAIYTDKRGTMARIRGNKRYGEYWAPKTDFRYYEIFNFDDCELSPDIRIPVGLEQLARPIGWQQPIDKNGNWMKNPIKPETATKNDYVVLYGEDDTGVVKADDEYLDEWLDD